MKKLLLLLSTIILISCGENKVSTKKIEKENNFEGFYDRIGTIQYVKGVAVDTVFYKDIKDSEGKIPRQVKAYVDGKFCWISNDPTPKTAKDNGIKMPWKSGAGGYGSYNYSASTNYSPMNEYMTNMIGNGLMWGPSFEQRGAVRDSILKNNSFKWEFTSTFDGNIYNHKWLQPDSVTTIYSELNKKIESSAEQTILDGVWKHIANVRYVNNIPVDTIGLPDGLDDHKLYHKGNVMVNYDFTLAKEGDQNFGGAGLIGKFTYKDGVLTEFFEMGTGNWTPPDTKVWSDGQSADIDMIDNDTFIQINRYATEDNGDGTFTFVEAKKEKNGLLHVRVK